MEPALTKDPAPILRISTKAIRFAHRGMSYSLTPIAQKNIIE